MKICYIDSSLHEEMLSIKRVLGHLETEHIVKLERLLVTHLPMVTGDYHTSAYFLSEYKAGDLQDHGQFPWH